MITGVHHVCVKCRPEELEKVQKFYGELLGLSLVRSWGEPKVEGMMYGAGTSLIEIFPNAEEDLPQGAIRHFALATDDVDSIVPQPPDSYFLNPIKLTFKPALNDLAPKIAGRDMRAARRAIGICSGFVA